MQRILQKKPRGFTLIELMIVVVIIGILASLAIYGVQKYVRSAKSGEAKTNVGAIAKAAVAAYEGETMDGQMLALGGVVGANRQLCLSAPFTVPAALATIAGGQKFQSSSADWNDNSPTPNPAAGWTCLKFNLNGPQYFMYSYTSSAAPNTPVANGDTFTASAIADFDADGVTAVFGRNGEVEAAADGSLTLKLSPAIQETRPDE